MTLTDAIALMPQQGNPDYLTLQDIADRCQVSYKTIRQYADIEAVRQFMGAYYHPSSKGARYPPDSLPRWLMLADAANKRLLTPATASAWLANVEISAPGDAIAQSPQQGETTRALTPVQAIAQLPAMGEQALDLGAEAVALLRQLVNQTAPPEDRLLTLQEAHTEYGLPLNVLRGLRVPVGRRYKVKRSAVLHYIAALT